MDFPLNTRPTIPFHDHPDYRRMVAERNLRRATGTLSPQPTRSTNHAVNVISDLLNATLHRLMTRKHKTCQGSFAEKRHADQANEGALLPPLRPRVRFSPSTQTQRTSPRRKAAFQRKVAAEQKNEGLLLATSPRCRRVRFVPSTQPPRLRLLGKKFQRKVKAEIARERVMLSRIRNSAGEVYTTADDAPALPTRTIAGSARPAQQTPPTAATPAAPRRWQQQCPPLDPNRATRPDAMLPYLRHCPRFKARVAELMALQANPLPPVTYEKATCRSSEVALLSPSLVGKQKDLHGLAPLVLPEAEVEVEVGRDERRDSGVGFTMDEGDGVVRDAAAGMKDCFVGSLSLGLLERDVQPLPTIAGMDAIDAVSSAAAVPVPALPKAVGSGIREIEERDALGEAEAMVHRGWYEDDSSADGLLRGEEIVGSDGIEGERVGWEVEMRREGDEVYEGW